MRKNGFLVMWQLLALVKPLAHIMAFTITMGTLGFLSAIFIMVLGAMGLNHLLGFAGHLNFTQILTALIALAVVRGILRYLEQMSGHYIAFKLLALLRDKVFSALRRLAFVKLQDKQRHRIARSILCAHYCTDYDCVLYIRDFSCRVCAYFRVVRVGGVDRLSLHWRSVADYYHQTRT